MTERPSLSFASAERGQNLLRHRAFDLRSFVFAIGGLGMCAKTEFDAVMRSNLSAAASGLLPGLIGAISAIAFIRGIGRLYLDDEGLRLVHLLGTKIRRWSELGPFAPDEDCVVSTWYAPEGAQIFKIPCVRNAIRLAEDLNTRRSHSLAAR